MMESSDDSEYVSRILTLLDEVDGHLEKRSSKDFDTQPFYNLIIHINKQTNLYRKIVKTVDSYLEVTNRRIRQFQQSLREAERSDQYLPRFNQLFENTKLIFRYVAHLFRCLQIASNIDVFDNCMKLFKKEVYEQEKPHLADRILQCMQVPNNEDAELIRQTTEHIRYLETIQPVAANLRDSFLCSTLCLTWLRAVKTDMIGKKSAWLASTDSALTYLLLAQDYLNEQMSWLEKYQLVQAEPVFPVRLATLFRAIFLKENMADLFANETSGCRVLLRTKQWDSLKLVFSLFFKVPGGLDLLAKYYHEELCRIAVPKIETFKEEQPKNNADAMKTLFVELITLLHEHESIVDTYFSGHYVLNNSLTKTFVYLCNEQLTTEQSVTLLCLNLDSLLKGEDKQLEEAELEFRLEKAVRMIAFLNEKDLFMELYRQQFAKRLLNKKSASDDMEKLTLSKMKRDWGGVFTVKLEGMLHDFFAGKELADQFASYCAERQEHCAVDLSITYLTAANWPTYMAIANLPLPMSVQEAIDKFSAFHFSKYNSRKLRWVHSLGTASIKFRPTGKMTSKPYDVQVTPVQAAIIILFNQKSEWSLREIVAVTQVPEDIVKKVLHSFSMGSKYQILLVSDKNKAEYAVNEKFTNKALKFGVPMPTLETKATDADAQEKVNEQRCHAIEAAIVRIMKARKQMMHQDLMAEVLKQLQFFKPDPKYIKKRMESLIEREYLERDADNPNMYKYLA